MSDVTPAGRTSWWPWALVAGAVVAVGGGSLHPDQDPTLPEAAGLAGWIGNPMWIPSHALILAGSILIGLGLLGLLRHRPGLSPAARRAGWVMVVGAGLWVVEGVPHMLAGTEGPAAASGQATPFLVTHMAVSLLAYPWFGFSVAAFALLGGRALAHPLLGVLALVGGIAWGIAPWSVGPLGIDPLVVLFPVGLTLVAAWLAVVGLHALVSRSTTTTAAGGAPA